jgi:hypothetical protein
MNNDFDSAGFVFIKRCKNTGGGYLSESGLASIFSFFFCIDVIWQLVLFQE